MQSFRNMAIGAAVVIVVASAVVTAHAAQVTINANLLTGSDVAITGAVSKGAGTFVIDHPLDPKNKLLYHSFVESPEAKNVYRGIAFLDENGRALVRLPSYFEALNKDYRYQLTGLDCGNGTLYIAQKITDNAFVIAGEPLCRVSWHVTGVRHDPYIEKYPIRVEVEKGPREMLDAGECIVDELCL